jgi:multicomponent Na+:H+ antiporter subunit G
VTASVLTEALLGVGVLITVLASVAAVVVRTVVDRLHFLTVITSVAAPLVGVALAIQNGWGFTTAQILLTVVLLAVTGPVLGAATGRLYHRTEQGAGR